MALALGCWKGWLKGSLIIREIVAGVMDLVFRRMLTLLRGAFFSSPNSEYARGLREVFVFS
jgi:hypothetical protein